MAVEAYSSLPFSAGASVASAAGRAVVWGASAYLRQPLRNSAMVAMVGLSLMAGTNILYRQAHHHPSPLFGSFLDGEATDVQPVKHARIQVMPATKPGRLSIDAASTTGSVDPSATTTIGNDDVMALQTKLRALNLYDGSADGLFGPRTARAIKAFEQKIGRSPRGLLTQQILDLVQTASIPAPAVLAPSAHPTTGSSGNVDLKPLAGPSPLRAASEGTAGLDVDTPADTVETLPMTNPGQASVTKRSVQTIAVRAAQPQTIPAPLEPATVLEDASTDPSVVAAVQRGLNSLGFLHGEVDGVAGEATAKAIRNFEVYYNFDVTGRITRTLVNLLVQNGAVI